MDDVIVDCSKCPYKHACCRAVRVELDDDEVDLYQTEQALSQRKNVNIVAQHNGRCVYLDPRTCRCTIWDKRPRVCRKYDCKDDKRMKEIAERDVLKPLGDLGKCKVVVSIAILEENDERKVSPMMVYSKHGPTACETFEVRGTGKPLEEAAKRMFERQLKELLGDAAE